MPDPDGSIENASLAEKIVTSRLLDDNLTTSTFTANSTFTGPYETNVAGADTQRITFDSGGMRQFTGNGNEIAPGKIETVASGSGDSQTLQTQITAPSFIDNQGLVGVFVVVRSASFDDSTSPSGVVVGDNGGSTQTSLFQLQNDMDLRLASGSVIQATDLGSTSDLVLGIGTNHDDGYYSPADSQLGTVIAGNETVRESATRTDFSIGALRYVTLPVKTDTGDPSSPQEGDIYVNTSDNVLRLFADAAWRTVGSW